MDAKAELSEATISGSRKFVSGCAIVLGTLILLLGFIFWTMIWGFAGKEQSFRALYHYTASASESNIIICPLEEWPRRASMYFLCGSVLIGAGYILRLRRFSLAKLMATFFAVAGFGAYPHVSISLNPATTIAWVQVMFQPDLNFELQNDLAERLKPESFVAWTNTHRGNESPPTLEEMTDAQYTVITQCKDSVRVSFEFSSSISRRNEVRDYFLSFFEEQIAPTAKNAGLAPIRPEGRLVRVKLIEK